MRMASANKLALIATLGLAGWGCAKNEGSGESGAKAAESSKAAAPAEQPSDPAAPATGEEPIVDIAALAAAIGVEPGGFEIDPETAPAAVLATEREGAVEIRRTGQDAFEPVSGADPVDLYAGDQVRLAGSGTALVVLADETTVELADDTAVAIGDRDASADPALSAAVLYGVARFSVSPRGEGEGPFLVYAPGGVVGTRGTTYAVGVSASGEARVGVEEGEVEVAGSAALDAPLVVNAGKAVIIALGGSVAQPAPFAEDDWGAWRDEAEASVDPAVVIEAHASRLEALEAQLAAAYDQLEALTGAASTAAAEAEAQVQAGNTAAYEAAAPDTGAAIEATFLASQLLQFQTYAMLSHAYLAQELRLRHPDKTRAVYVRAAPRVTGALLHHKKYHVAVHHHVRPLRAAYYVHHPVGRARAVAVAHPVPPAFVRTKLRPVEPKQIEARLAFKVYRPPVLRPAKRKPGKAKIVRVHAPDRNWYDRVKVEARPRPPRKAGWYVAPPAPRARVMAGVKVEAPYRPAFKASVRAPKGKAMIKWKDRGRVGGAAGASVDVRDHRGGKPGASVDVRSGVPGASVDVRDHRGGKPGAAIGTEIRDHRGALPAGEVSGKGAAFGTGGVKIRDHRDTKDKPGVNIGGGVRAGGSVGIGIGGKVKADKDEKKPSVRDHRGGK